MREPRPDRGVVGRPLATHHERRSWRSHSGLLIPRAAATHPLHHGPRRPGGGDVRSGDRAMYGGSRGGDRVRVVYVYHLRWRHPARARAPGAASGRRRTQRGDPAGRVRGAAPAERRDRLHQQGLPVPAGQRSFAPPRSAYAPSSPEAGQAMVQVSLPSISDWRLPAPEVSVALAIWPAMRAS